MFSNSENKFLICFLLHQFIQMNAYYAYLNVLFNQQKHAYKEFNNINWLNPYVAENYEKIRTELLKSFSDHTLFLGTKPYLNHISEGCKRCGEGLWSCLFITGKCNAKCFYCPSSQEKDEMPSTQGLSFESPEAYAEYINYFGFKGVSFSGGEPLLFTNRVLSYLKELRKTCSPDIYTWMYTNGILATKTNLEELANAGLNEIRVDIGATNYSLKSVQLALKYIPVVSIEIPTIPEDLNRIKNLLPKLIDLGLKNLNLHQLRLTPFNAHKLIARKYTIIPAERPIVLESEMAALELLNYAKTNQFPIGINYCSFHFKHRFQKAGYRKIIAKKLADGSPEITEKGFVRKVVNNELFYESYALKNAEDLHCSNNLTLKHKTYSIQKTLTMKKTNLNNSILDLLKEAPSMIPEKQIEFTIWQQEYIEKNLRSY